MTITHRPWQTIFIRIICSIITTIIIGGTTRVGFGSQTGSVFRSSGAHSIVKYPNKLLTIEKSL